MHLGYFWPFDLHPSFLLSRKVVSVNFKGIMKIEQASHHDKITACLNGPIFQPGSNTKGILIPQCRKTHKIVQFLEVTLHIICLKSWNNNAFEITFEWRHQAICIQVCVLSTFTHSVLSHLHSSTDSQSPPPLEIGIQ